MNRAAALFEEACGKGALTGCSALAPMLEVGDRIGRNLPRAKELYARTCDGGIAADCYALGRTLQRDSTTSDRKPAFEAFSKGCAAGFAPACHEVGVAWEAGHDPKRALGFYREGVRQRAGRLVRAREEAPVAAVAGRRPRQRDSAFPATASISFSTSASSRSSVSMRSTW